MILNWKMDTDKLEFDDIYEVELKIEQITLKNEDEILIYFDEPIELNLYTNNIADFPDDWRGKWEVTLKSEDPILFDTIDLAIVHIEKMIINRMKNQF